MGLIPPALGIFSYFRVDDFDSLQLIQASYSSFSLNHLIQFFSEPFYQYYRPTGLIWWWIGYLVGGMNPVIYHIIVCVFFGLICSNIFLIGTYTNGMRAGWLSALIYITFTPIAVVSWWISNMGVGFGAMVFFTWGILGFICLQRSPKILTLLTLFCFTWALFAKNAYVFLSPLPLLLYLFVDQFRTKRHLFLSCSVLMISIISVITEQLMTKGRGINSHIHLNILELPAEMVIQNLSDYWSLLLYGHSPYLTVFALAYGITKFKKSFVDIQYIIVLAILFFAITALMKWSPGLLVLACLVLGLSFFVTENWQGKLWTFWIVLGLSQTMFWDIRIIGGLLNRFILESSVGFALLIGYGLSCHLDYIKTCYKVLKADQYIKSFMLVSMVSLFLIGTVYHSRGYIYDMFIREIRMTYDTSYIIRDVLSSIRKAVPDKGVLLIDKTLVEGVEHHSQITNGLFNVGRADIRHTFIEHDQLRSAISDHLNRSSSFYMLTKRSLPELILDEYNVSPLYTISHGVYEAYLYIIQSQEIE